MDEIVISCLQDFTGLTEPKYGCCRKQTNSFKVDGNARIVCIPFSAFPVALCFERNNDPMLLSYSQEQFIRCHRETVLSITALYTEE